MRDLEFVRHLARATGATTDVDRVLHLALEVVCDHLGAVAGTVWQCGPGSEWQARHRYRAEGSGEPPSAEGLPEVVASMLATGTPSSLWRDDGGHSVAAALVGGDAQPVAVLQIGLSGADGAQPLLSLCETTAELLTRVVERASSQAQLLEAQQLARLGSWQWDATTDTVEWSEQLLVNFGIDEGDLEPSLDGFLAWMHPEDRERATQLVSRALDDLQPFELTFRTLPDDADEVRWLLGRGRVVADPDGRPAQLAGTVQDVTDRVTLEHELAYQATHDVLTGLANREVFQRRLEQLLATGAERTVAVAVIDVDQFGSIATRLGGDAGDQLLRAAGARLAALLEPDAIAARLVGNEFAVAVAEDDTRPELAPELGARLLAAFHEPFEVHDASQRLTASVGVASTAATTVSGTASPESLLRDAALAVDLARTRGGGRVQRFDPDQHEQALQQLALEADLRQAIDQGDLTVVYQPVVDLASGSMVATEALVRWDRPGHGMVSPTVFVPLAEQLGLAGRFGSQVLLTACQQHVAWQREFPHAADFSVAVNLSAVQLDDTNVVATVEEALQRSGLAPEHLTLEVTESALPDDAAGALTRLWALRHLGVGIAIDDFGTGYSTLSRLRELPVDVLKIDRSFLTDTGRDAPILQALFAMARTLELSTVTEGVETAAQLQVVLANHGDRVQGYLFSKPLPPDGITRLLRDPGWDTAELTAVAERHHAVAIADHEHGHVDTLLEAFLATTDPTDPTDPADPAGPTDAHQLLRDLLVEVAIAIDMESVYLTRVDLAAGRQDIEVAVNRGALVIPEGESVDWADTLCRRALLTERTVLPDVRAEYPEVAAGDELGIATFMAAPIRSSRGGLQGTLCAASAEFRNVDASAVQLLTRIAGLVGERLSRSDGAPVVASPLLRVDPDPGR